MLARRLRSLGDRIYNIVCELFYTDAGLRSFLGIKKSDLAEREALELEAAMVVRLAHVTRDAIRYDDGADRYAPLYETEVQFASGPSVVAAPPPRLASEQPLSVVEPIGSHDFEEPSSKPAEAPDPNPVTSAHSNWPEIAQISVEFSN